METKLTLKEQAWAEAYLETYNKTEAARRAKYKGNDATLSIVGYENYRKPKIQAYLKTRLQEAVMSADEVLKRFAEEARLNIAEFLIPETLNIDPKKVHEKGHLVKSITPTKYGPKIELYDSQSARLNLGKELGLFTDRHIVEMKLEKEVDSILDVLEELLSADDFSRILSRLGNSAPSQTETAELPEPE